MDKKSYIFSVILHAGIILFLWMDWSFVMSSFDKAKPVPVIMVDLSKVQIGEITNLPKEVKKETKKAAPKAEEKPKTESKTATTAVKPKEQPAEPAKPKPTPEKKNSAKAVEPPVKKEPKKDNKKDVKKKDNAKASTPAKSEDKPKKSGADMKSLLASVDQIKKNARPSTQTQAPTETGQEVQQGIEGGSEGSLMQPLTISEKDLIVTKLRGCWNVDAGVDGIENMIVEIKAIVNRDGRVQKVDILNMKSNPSFRAVAESAKRAVYICDTMGEESPFRMLANTRAENYNNWKEIYVRFNPMDGGVY